MCSFFDRSNRTTRLLYSVALSVLACACGKQETPAGAAVGPPVAVSVTPSSGSGNAAAFVVKFSQPGGYKQLSDVRLLINADTNGRDACYVYYSVPSNSFLLVNDSGEGSKAAVLGSGASIDNSQCTVLTQGATVAGDGSDLSVTIPIRFKPAFAGDKKLVLFAEAASGAHTDLVLKGEYEAVAISAAK